MKELIYKLNKASDTYYNGLEPIMSDKEWDNLYDRLIQLEKESGAIYSNSPTQRVGYEVKNNLEKVEHTKAMLSLDKTKDIKQLEKFTNKESVLSWKEDGLTIVIQYEDGMLIKGVTRGNGIIGSDITHNVKVFKNIPKTINYKGYLEIRGEGLISKSDFEKLNVNGEYKNPRNLASGSIMLLDSKIASKRSLQFKAFGIVECEKKFNLYSEQLEWLRELGFNVVEYKIVTPEIIEKTVLEFKEELLTYDFATDGLVQMINDLEYGESLGTTSKHPNNAIAFKWQDEIQETVLRDIEFQVGRTGVLTPIGVFDDVELEGTTVNKASVHNLSILKELQLGIGDIITVYKANAIIPQIDDNITRSNTFKIPTECPACRNILKIEKSDKAEFLACDNLNCSGRLVQKLSHYCSRNCMNIDGISEAIIETFINKGIIKGILDLYKLERYKYLIINMDGFGLKSYNNMVNSIEKSKKVKLSNFLFALGIDLVGNEASKKICKHFKNDLEGIRKATIDDFCEVEDIGIKTAKSLYNWLNNAENSILLDELVDILSFEQEKEVVVLNSNNILFGKSIYPTGKFALKKNDLKVRLQEIGAVVETGYKKSLDYLICGGDTSKSGKADKAIKDNVKIMTEEELMELLK